MRQSLLPPPNAAQASLPSVGPGCQAAHGRSLRECFSGTLGEAVRGLCKGPPPPRHILQHMLGLCCASLGQAADTPAECRWPSFLVDTSNAMSSPLVPPPPQLRSRGPSRCPASPLSFGKDREEATWILHGCTPKPRFLSATGRRFTKQCPFLHLEISWGCTGPWRT